MHTTYAESDVERGDIRLVLDSEFRSRSFPDLDRITGPLMSSIRGGRFWRQTRPTSASGSIYVDDLGPGADAPL